MGPWAVGVPLVLISVLGLLLNAYVLLVVLGLRKQTQQQQTANTFLLIHLGAVESAACLILLVVTISGWPVAGTWCSVHGFLLTLLHPVALWTITGLNCERYYAIAAPLHYTAVVSPRRVILGIIASWTISLLLCLPPFSGFVPPYEYSPGFGCCVLSFDRGNWGTPGILYATVYVIFGLALPAILVTICNLRVLGIARYHRHRIASAIYEVTLSAQVTITHQRNPFFVPSVTAPSAGGPPKFHNAASSVMQLVGSLYLLYFPYCGLILWEACNDVVVQNRLHAHPRLVSLASLLLASSPPINGLLYGLKSRTLRRSVQNYWRKKITKSELQQEIQARTPSVAGSRRPSGSGPVSLFPFPPLQRRLSEALLNLGTNGRQAGFENGSFSRSRLQSAASCNTLRVPATESSETGSRVVRTSASAASLMGHYRNEPGHPEIDFSTSDTSKRSPRILITRTYSTEGPEGDSPFLKRSCITSNTSRTSNDKNKERRWRHMSAGSDSSTGSSETSIWTTKMLPRKTGSNMKNSMDNWPVGKRFKRVRTLEEGAMMIVGIRANNNSESSDTTDTTATTTILPSKPISMAEEQKKTKNADKQEIDLEHSYSDSDWSSTEEDEKIMNKNLQDGKNCIDSCSIEMNNDSQVTVIEKYRRKRREKSLNATQIIQDEKISGDREGVKQLRPLLIPSS